MSRKADNAFEVLKGTLEVLDMVDLIELLEVEVERQSQELMKETLEATMPDKESK